MPGPKASWTFKGGSVLSTRQVPAKEKKEMRKEHDKIWGGFDSKYADKYDKKEPACKRAKRSEKDSQTAELCSDDPNDVPCEHANRDRRASPPLDPNKLYWSAPQEKHDVHCGMCGMSALDLNPVLQTQPFFCECLECGFWCCDDCFYAE